MAERTSKLTRVLITRPIQQAEKTADRLKEMGHTVHLDPLLDVKNLHIVLTEPNAYQAVLLSSANAVQNLASINPDVPVFTVGDATAEAVRATYPNRFVMSANGKGEDLAALVIQRLNSQNGPLLYLSGEEIHYDLPQHLRKSHFKVDRIICYQAQMATDFLSSTKDLLCEHLIQYILFYSRRTALTFAKIILESGTEGLLTSMRAIAISEDVGAALKDLPFQKINIARAPTEADLLKELHDEE